MATLSLSPSTEDTILEPPSSLETQAPAPAEMSGPDAYEFLRRCLSHRSTTERRSALQPFLDAGVDWSVIRREARRHRVLPLLFHALEEVLGDRLPSSLQDQIREHRRGVRIQNTFVIQELGRVHRRFEDAGLPLLAMKGPVLAQTAYGDIALRQSVDADVVVPRDRFSEVDRLLRELGYEYAEKRKPMWGWQEALSRYLDGQWEFTRGNTFTLDVHTRLMPPGYSFPSDFYPFWERARAVQLNGDVDVHGFSPEDQVLVLAHHGIKNQWRALRHIVDIAAVIRGHDDLDWDLLRSRAGEMHAARALKLGLHMAHDLLDVTLPRSIWEWSLIEGMDSVAAPLKTYLQNRSEKTALAYGDRVQLQLATKDTVAGQIRYGAHSLLQHFWSALLRP